MHFSLNVLSLLSLTTLILARPTDVVKDTSIRADYYEAIQQSEYRLADILDRKDYASLGQGMTQDSVYDNSALPGGSVLRGLDEIREKTAQAFGNAQVRHDVTTGLIEPLGVGKARVITYLIFSRWDAEDLYNVSKTFRMYEKCDDIWVLDQGLWKLKYSKVTNMGPKAEGIYWGKEKN